jgi:hypothetical protein
MRHRCLACLLLAACAAGAAAQTIDRPGGALVRIDPASSLDAAPPQPDRAYRPRERDHAMAEKPSNGCPCESNNRCTHSLTLNYCVAKDGRRVYLQRYWE